MAAKLSFAGPTKGRLCKASLLLLFLYHHWRRSSLVDDNGINNNSPERTNGKTITKSNAENDATVSATTDFQYHVNVPCKDLMTRYGFWSQLQCDLWRFVENKTTIDMTPYLINDNDERNADNWWNRNDNNTAQQPKLITHLHLHKCAGSFVCQIFRQAQPHPQIATFRRKSMSNPNENCNVPIQWWKDVQPVVDTPWHTRQPTTKLGVQYASYVGTDRTSMQLIYQRIKQQGWRFVANEGSLEAAPLLGEHSPYYHTTILRDPLAWIVSMWHYDDRTHNRKTSLKQYLNRYFWGGPDFFTRRICGVECVAHRYPRQSLLKHDFLRAKSMLQHFDVVWVLEELQADATSFVTTQDMFRHAFPGWEFPWSQLHHKTNARMTGQADDKLSNEELALARDKIEMDKVLYEYAKLLHLQQIREIVTRRNTNQN